jgi:CheY-like chemotaxis protein
VRRRTGRILLGEDNVTNQFVVLAILQKLGWRADAVANGKEALISLRSMPYDLVLMDCQMPEMNGFQAAAAVRDPQSGVRNPAIPIIAVTANAMQGDREDCLAAGMDDYIAKPIEPAALAALLDKWLPEPTPVATIRDSITPVREPRNIAPPVFDEPALVARLMGDRELARKIVGAFLDDVPAQLAALQSHVAAGDAAAVVLQAHNIKGAAANAAAIALHAVALQLERAGRASNLDAMSAGLRELQGRFETTREAMKRMKNAGLVHTKRSQL